MILPGHRDAHFGKGSIFQNRQHFDEALASYDKTLAIDPDYVDALNNRYVVLVEFRAQLRSAGEL